MMSDGTIGARGARVFIELVANGFIVTTYAEHLPQNQRVYTNASDAADDVRGRLLSHESMLKGPIDWVEPA